MMIVVMGALRQGTLWLGPALWLALSSCAYQMRREDYRLRQLAVEREKVRVFVPIFDNTTTVARFEAPLTSAFRKALLKVQGVSLVNQASDADVLIMGSVYSIERAVADDRVIVGNADSQSRGGLLAGATLPEYLATDVRVRLKLLERVAPGTVKLAWEQDLKDRLVFRNVNRLENNQGRASAPNINDSREEFQLDQMADRLASRLMDQVVGDF